jgi:hypothetical protein
MDKLDRRLIQLKIEREAVRKEKDEASKKRLALIEEEIARLGQGVLGPRGDLEGGEGAGAGLGHDQGGDRAACAEMARLQRKGELDKLARSSTAAPAARGAAEAGRQKVGPPIRSEEASPAAHAGRRRGDRRGGLARDRHPVSKMMQGEREKLLRWRRSCTSAWSARTRRCGSCRTPSAARAGPVGPEPALRLVPLPRPHRRRQDGAVQGAGLFPVRFRGAPDPHRHERVHGEALGRAAHRRAARLRRLRGGRPPDRGGAAQALLGDPARRGREGAPGCLQRAAAGARRRPHDRRPGPHRGLQEHRDRHDLQPGQPDDPADVARRATTR